MFMECNDPHHPQLVPLANGLRDCPVKIGSDNPDNLYLNAIESMDSGGTLTISSAKDGAKNRMEIRIGDTGTGIPEADIAHIFDPYFTTKSSGTGLGLAIAHKIIEGHHGEIYPESRLGYGTVFIISLPYG